MSVIQSHVSLCWIFMMIQMPPDTCTHVHTLVCAQTQIVRALKSQGYNNSNTTICMIVYWEVFMQLLFIYAGLIQGWDMLLHWSLLSTLCAWHNVQSSGPSEFLSWFLSPPLCQSCFRTSASAVSRRPPPFLLPVLGSTDCFVSFVTSTSVNNSQWQLMFSTCLNRLRWKDTS